MYRMSTVRHIILIFTTAWVGTTSATAQSTPVPVAFLWELSKDGGASWQQGSTIVDATNLAVDARLRIAWTSPVSTAQDFFGNARFDGTVQGLVAAGSLDTVTSITALVNGVMQTPLAAVQGRRFSTDLIKIDLGDPLPPGQGAFVTVNNAPALGGLTAANPVTVLQYRLNLDGSPGSRIVSCALPTSQPVSIALFGLPAGQQPTFVPTVQSATLVVVPSPSCLTLAGLAGAVLLRRRRSDTPCN
jgi:hypothetical protein